MFWGAATLHSLFQGPCLTKLCTRGIWGCGLKEKESLKGAFRNVENIC